jgi:hypothetical protein
MESFAKYEMKAALRLKMAHQGAASSVWRNSIDIGRSREFMTRPERRAFERGKSATCLSVAAVSFLQLKTFFTTGERQYSISLVTAEGNAQQRGKDAYKLDIDPVSRSRIFLADDLSQSQKDRLMVSWDGHHPDTGEQMSVENILHHLKGMGHANQKGVEEAFDLLKSRTELVSYGAAPITHAHFFPR